MANELLRSLQSTSRRLLRAPAFVVTATLTLGIGIGLSTAVFAVADALLLRSLPIHDQDQVVALWAEKREGGMDHWPLGITQVREFTDRSRSLSDISYVDFYGALAVPVLDGNDVTRLRRALVSGNYFHVLGTRAALGRTLALSDDAIGAAPVVVISDATWRRRFGADPGVIGRKITELDGTGNTIVGVMPAGFEYPPGADYWAPYTPIRLRTARDSSFSAVDLVARLAPGATAANARSDLTAYLDRPDASPWSRSLRAVVNPLPRLVLGDARASVLAFAAAAALLLLITCIDVANLLLARGLARVREIAVRSALGATRSQVAALLLKENALIAVVGGALGIAVAVAAVRGFVAFAPGDVPLLDTIGVRGATVAGAAGITALTMLLFGLAPALVTARAHIQDVLRSGTRHGASRGSRLIREALVGAQVALAVVLLCAAALIGRSFMKLQNATLAFDSSRLLVAELGMRYDQYDNLEKQLRVLNSVLARVRVTPGVEAASPVVAVPFSGTAGWTGRAGIAGQSPEEASKNPMFSMELVTPDYFTTFGLRVLSGRRLTEADVRGAEAVVVVSQSTARSYWPNQDPVGKRLLMGGALDQSFTVVGVVPDTRYRDLREARPSVYYPLAQSIFPFAPTKIAIRAAGSPAAMVPAIRRAVAEAAPGVVLESAAPFDVYMEAPLAQPRLNAFLLGVFAFAAATLAAIGLFGIMAMMVRQRTRELGVRMALGATVGRVQAMIVSRGLAIAVLGTAAGMGGALAANRLLASLLYELSPTDVPTLLGVSLLVLGIALLGTYLPARAGSRIDPAIALRSEN